MLDRAADLADIDSQPREMVGEPWFGEYQQRGDVISAGELHRAEIQAHRKVRKARAVLRAEGVVVDRRRRVLLARAIAELRKDRQAPNLGDRIAWKLGRVDDRAIDGLGTGLLDGQRIARVVRARHHETGTAHEVAGT